MHAPVHVVRSHDPSQEQWSVPSDDCEQITLTYDRLGIGEARTLQSLAYSKPAESTYKCIVFRAYDITVEAQNALLKLLEEPPVSTRCVIIVPHTLRLLPTLLSRVQEVYSDTALEQSDVWQTFVAAPVAERLTQIETNIKAKDAAWLVEMHRSLIAWMRADTSVTPALQLVAERLQTRGASNKMLLELLALELKQE